MLKLIIIAVFILNAGNVIGNENQYYNEYYDREECVRNVIQRLISEQSDCLNYFSEYASRGCTLTDEEIKKNIIVYCGEELQELQDAQQEPKNKDLK